ncbi:MAG: polyribonucleotide nucleotidyltransferase [Deltaproteobacteria bacterium]|nr:polyribonucleotide nucleotidyltransferase [Deltaproteobacteria bacterium]MBW2361658.1 polyribonucleotide nucleotidyltransferase [Deltaproteobacteria bacterium]
MANYWFEPTTVSVEVGGRALTLETGRLAKQAAGAVVVTYGETVVLVTAARAKPRPGIDFFPLVVDFVEKTSAAGKIPGGFFKREGRLSDREVLASRFIDRTVRPLFPSSYNDETQIIATVISADAENPADMPAFVGASAALTISEMPFLGPIAAARVARIDGELVVNPTLESMVDVDIDLVVAGSRAALVMVEGTCNQASEADVLAALKFAHEAIIPQIDVQEELQKLVGKEKLEVAEPEDRSALDAEIRTKAEARLGDAVRITAKKERYDAIAAVESEVLDGCVSAYRSEPFTVDTLDAIDQRQSGLARLRGDVKDLLHDLRSELIRKRILDEGTRIDGRKTTDIRQIACEVRSCPRPHGVGLFTRGETQAMVFTTLGGKRDQQTIDTLLARVDKPFYLHYNFPPFSVGEARMQRGPGRREVGHGNLAERALIPVLPDQEEFPYTIRIVSEVLESNGSSSMATVCGGTLSLMDAGVPLAAPVAGIAMGLIEEGDRVAILSDILGDEDHLGDMDFKVAGTREGITALQMDIKIPSVDWKVMEEALEQARAGRLHILECMASETAGDFENFKPRAELSRYAPRVKMLMIKPDRIRDIIGPGGKVIRAIQETTNTKIDVDDSGTVTIFSPDGEALDAAEAMVNELTQEAELDRVYMGKVKRITDFGAFVEIFPGTDGLIHISHLAEGRVERVEDVVSEGDEVLAKCIDIDPTGRIRLSRKEALADAGTAE